jgi:histidinol-phosphate aminotransferase
MIEIEKIVKSGVFKTERRNTRAKLATRKDYLRLDLNENLVDLSEKDFADMISRIKPEAASAYPDLAEVYKKMAEHLGVGEDQVVLTNGSDMAIKTIFDACVEKSDHIVLHDPYFLMYQRYAEFFEATFDAVPVSANWTPDVAEMLAKVNSRTKLVVVERPTGNLGQSVTEADIEWLATELERRNVLLVIDEAYMYVSPGQSNSLSLVSKHSNVVIIRTVSKAHGLAGARLGMLVTNPRLAREFYKVRSLYEISGLTAAVVTWHLDHPQVLSAYQEIVNKSKAYLISELRRLSLAYRDTDANFLMIELAPGGDISDITDQLKASGILIGKPFTIPALSGWARVTVGTVPQCQQFVRAIETIRTRSQLAA